MTTNKYLSFAAPYTAKTFNAKDNLIFGQNGVVSGGTVTQSGSVATIAAPFTFVQNGLIVNIPDVPLSVTISSGLSAPYFIAVSVSSGIQNTAEVISPVIIKRPQDITSNVVLVAEWDGFEWKNLPKLQISERIKYVANQNVNTGFTGVSSGCNITEDSSNFYVAGGTVIGKDGVSSTKTVVTPIAKGLAPAVVSQAYDRIDAIVFRKPADNTLRTGLIKSVTGPSFVGLTGTVVEAPTAFGSAAVTLVKTKGIRGTGYTVTCYLEGTALKARVVDDTLTLVSSFTVVTGVIDYNFVGDFDNYLNFIYTSSATSQTALNYIRTDVNGVVQTGPAVLYASPNLLYQPDLVCVGNAASFHLHMAVSRQKTGSVREIGYLRLAADGITLDTPYVTWLDLSANLEQPSLAKDDDDLTVFLGYGNADTGRVYLQSYDTGSVTSSTPPTAMSGAVELQLDVYNTAMSSLMPTTGALNVRVIHTDNKETFVTWTHPLPTPGQYGIAVYNSRFKGLFGHSALMYDSTVMTDYSADVDGMNNLYVAVINAAGTQVIKNVYDLESAKRVGTQDVVRTSTGIASVGLHFCPRGELLLTTGEAASGSWTKMTAAVKTTLRTQKLCPTDVYLGYYRVSDTLLAVSDNIIGEDPSVKRLYDFRNMFGASATIAWGVTITNTLTVSDLVVRFLDRQSTYTVPGFTEVIPGNYVLYTEIPDADTNTTLSTFLEPFGAGILDRVGKTAIPLFWNIGGRLYSNFSPFSFGEGESGNIGSAVSDQLIAWLGSGSDTPDPEDHAYSSTYYIAQDDSHNTAIGKLDTAVGSWFWGILPLTSGTKSVSVVFGSPKASASFVVAGQFQNLTDAAPMYQPWMTTAKSVNGFTVSWQAALDSGNYNFEYFLHGL